MSKRTKKLLINSILPIISAVAVAGLAYAAWTEPGTTPPGNNVDAPINVSAIDQTFIGSKRLNMAASNAGLFKVYGGFLTTGVADIWGTTTLATVKGNVGIGTAAPGAKLEIAGQLKITGGSPGANKVLTSDASGLATWTTITGTLPAGLSGQTLRHDGTNWVANSNLYNNGTNVGIGTAAPAAKLDVAGAVDTLFKLIRSGATYATIFRVGTDGALIINNSNIDTMTLKRGNVGIGTANPDVKLDVVGGKAQAEDFCLQDNSKCLSSGGGGDYVKFAGYSNPVKGNYGSKTASGSVGNTYPGVEAMNYRCATDHPEHPGSRMCTASEASLLWIRGELTILGTGNNTYAWIQPTAEVYHNCADWTVNRGGLRGMFLRWSLNTDGGFNDPIPTIISTPDCTTGTYPIACCY